MLKCFAIFMAYTKNDVIEAKSVRDYIVVFIEGAFCADRADAFTRAVQHGCGEV